MNLPILARRVVSALFALASIVQMTQLLAGLRVGMHVLGLFLSVALLAGTITLSLWLWRLASTPPPAAPQNPA